MSREAEPKRLGSETESVEEVILVRVASGRHAELESDDEIKDLIRGAGGSVAASVSQKLGRPDPRFYIGSGKLDEVMDLAREKGVFTLVFDHNLSPGQVAKLEEATDCKVLDRTELILAIFAIRARTREARLQIELAQLEYALPRLTRKWHHLSRLGAGIGTRGPGETQLEIDRRRARSRIKHLQEEIEAIDRQRKVRRERRKGLYSVALAGYTNAGKSTLLNALCEAEVYSADKPFATLDTVSRRLALAEDDYVLLSDTVGFIRRLPETLVASFQATLAVVREADLLLIVADRSAKDRQERLDTVFRTLDKIGAGGIPRILVWNKTDLTAGHDRPTAGIAVSALQQTGLSKLREAIRYARGMSMNWFELSMRNPDGRFLNWLFENCKVDHLQRSGENVEVLAGTAAGIDSVRQMLGRHGFEWSISMTTYPSEAPMEAIVNLNG